MLSMPLNETYVAFGWEPAGLATYLYFFYLFIHYFLHGKDLSLRIFIALLIRLFFNFYTVKDLLK